MKSKIVLATLLILTTLSVQAEEILRPVFTRDRQFVMTDAVPAESLRLMDSPVKAFLFSHAESACGLLVDEAQFRMSQIFQFQQSSVMGNLRAYFPGFVESDLKGLQVLVDDFGSARNSFRSFYLKPQHGVLNATISVDCDSTSQSFWDAYIAHELTHHLNKDRGLSQWLDEMLAQQVEIQNTMTFPVARTEVLRNSPWVPGFFSDNVFQDSQKYAVNLLFGLYVKQLFGEKFFKQIPNGTKSVADFSLVLQKYISGKPDFAWAKEIVTPAGLIRHFQLAMAINAPMQNGTNFFKINFWSGFDGAVFTSGSAHLFPGSALRVSTADFIAGVGKKTLPSNLEAYRILKNGWQFKIVKANEVVRESWPVDFVILINTSETQTFDIMDFGSVSR
jgi:hypothetical protein